MATIHATAEQIRALNTLDVVWGIAQLPPHIRRFASTQQLLVGMHKARYEHSGCDAKLRHESRQWLEARGFRRIDGKPWPEPGMLPS